MTSRPLPAPQVERCIGRIDPARPMLLAILMKRTFTVRGSQAIPAEAAEPFVVEEQTVPASTGAELLRRSPEIVPDRDHCDLLVLATARSAVATTRAEVTLQAPGIARTLVVQGDRTAERTGSNWRFSPPAPWTEMSLGWDRAYGGIDVGVRPDPARPGDMMRAAMIHPGAYPRNDVGRGFSLAESTLSSDGMPLPNVELPDDLLTSGRFQCERRERWHLQPRPAGFGPVPAHWFPRSLHMGTVAGVWPDPSTALAEESSGLLPPGFLAHQRAASPDELTISPGFFQVSAPGLFLPRPRGDERIVLQGIDDGRELALDLPGGCPRIALSAPGRTLPLEPRLFQVLWDVDPGVCTMLWGAGIRVDHPALVSVPEEALMELPVSVT